jgi:hypothetical protein
MLITMTKKLKLNPNVSYLLGLYQCSPDKEVGIATESQELVQKFVKLLIDEFGIAPNKILINESDKGTAVMTYNSGLKKLFNAALERKLKIFKWKNAYSANYIAGIFDCDGGVDAQGLYIKHLSESDGMLLELLGIHTFKKGSKSYFVNQNALVAFIKGYSLRF